MQSSKLLCNPVSHLGKHFQCAGDEEDEELEHTNLIRPSPLREGPNLKPTASHMENCAL